MSKAQSYRQRLVASISKVEAALTYLEASMDKALQYFIKRELSAAKQTRSSLDDALEAALQNLEDELFYLDAGNAQRAAYKEKLTYAFMEKAADAHAAKESRIAQKSGIKDKESRAEMAVQTLETNDFWSMLNSKEKKVMESLVKKAVK